MINHTKFKRRQGGFTMLELVFVIVIIGILGVIGAKQFGIGIFGGAKGEAIYETTKKLSQNTVILAQTAGVPATVAANPLAAAGKTLLDVLVGGSGNLAPAYSNVMDTAGVTPLSSAVQSSGGTYSISGYPFTFGGGAGGPGGGHTFVFTFPDTITSQLVSKYGSGVKTLAASDAADPNVQYTVVDASGNRTVTIFHPL